MGNFIKANTKKFYNARFNSPHNELIASHRVEGTNEWKSEVIGGLFGYLKKVAFKDVTFPDGGISERVVFSIQNEDDWTNLELYKTSPFARTLVAKLASLLDLDDDKIGKLKLTLNYSQYDGKRFVMPNILHNGQKLEMKFRSADLPSDKYEKQVIYDSYIDKLIAKFNNKYNAPSEEYTFDSDYIASESNVSEVVSSNITEAGDDLPF